MRARPVGSRHESFHLARLCVSDRRRTCLVFWRCARTTSTSDAIVGVGGLPRWPPWRNGKSLNTEESLALYEDRGIGAGRRFHIGMETARDHKVIGSRSGRGRASARHLTAGRILALLANDVKPALLVVGGDASQARPNGRRVNTEMGQQTECDACAKRVLAYR
jgi:hypothetical protein